MFIIDEEQRFGVFQKEKLKERYPNTDMLSLSATPIPRTLSLTMSDLQDVTIINTPPIGRKSVKNYIGSFSKELIKRGLQKEKKRGGLSLIVYNNIEKLDTFKSEMCTLVPDIRFRIIHAKLNPVEIEDTLVRFLNHEIDTLICTTIIENGIDIPSVNTLFIIQAENFGLTQLYQLRGRIGRSSGQAYAYFMVSKKELTENARKRLEVIEEFSELGSGFKIAEQDLKIRGAGSLLGNKQHGHIEALGFHYYFELLKKTIRMLRNKNSDAVETEFNIKFPLFISEAFIPDSDIRVNVYKDILSASAPETILDTAENLKENFGTLHLSVTEILFAQVLKLLCIMLEIKKAEIYREKAHFTLSPFLKEDAADMKEFSELFGLKPINESSIEFQYPDIENTFEDLLLYAIDLAERREASE